MPDSTVENLAYLALSHRWGGADVLKLTNATLQSMLIKIVTKELPQTFQDAIHITRKLGYRYLWIDSLCIIQDDAKDWEREASRMSQVYSNCVLTIAALWGNDSHAGCFVERNPLRTQDCRIAIAQNQGIYVRSTNTHRGQSLGLLTDKPLLRRKWVLQERLLTPRTLYYGPCELHWECTELEANETVPTGNIDIWYKNSLKSQFKDLKPLPTLIGRAGFLGASVRKKDEFFEFHKVWTDILNHYWSSQLTRYTDILVAISGITTAIASKTNLTLMSGLWKEFLPLELLWKVGNPSETTKTSLCQTWSWASVKGAALSTMSSEIIIKTCIFYLSFGSYAEMVDASGAIKASGPLFHTTLQRNSQGAFLCHDNRLLEHTYHLDVTPSSDVVDVTILMIAKWQPDLPKKDLGPTGEWPGYIRLILTPVNVQDSTYERIGIWDHYVSAEKINIAPEHYQSFRLV